MNIIDKDLNARNVKEAQFAVTMHKNQVADNAMDPKSAITVG